MSCTRNKDVAVKERKQGFMVGKMMKQNDVNLEAQAKYNGSSL